MASAATAVVGGFVRALAEFSRATLAAAGSGLTVGATRGAKPINDDVVVITVGANVATAAGFMVGADAAAAVVFMVGTTAVVVVGAAPMGRPVTTAAGLTKRESRELLPGPGPELPELGAVDGRSDC